MRAEQNMESVFFLITALIFVIKITLANNIIEDIVVLDNFLNAKDLKSLQSLFASNEKWIFQNVHHQVSFTEPPSTAHSITTPNQTRVGIDDDSSAIDTSHFWTTQFEPRILSNHSAWIKTRKHVALKFGLSDDSQQLVVYNIEAQISGRGDAIKIVKRCPSKINNNGKLNIVVIIFIVHEKWRKNDYGEIVVYDKNEEVVRAIHPMNGRAVVIPCGFSYIIKPPAMDNAMRLRTLTLHVRDNQSLDYQHGQSMVSNSIKMREKQNHPMFELLPSNLTMTKMEISKYVTRKYVNHDGQSVFVFDDFLPDTITEPLEQTIRNGMYSDHPPEAGSYDNVQWILAFEVEALIETPLWSYVQQLLTFVSGKDGYYPYDVSCNAIRSHDSTTIHRDCLKDEDDLSVLMYFNKNWSESFHGETVFFTDDHNSEILCAVKPKFGRVVVFHGAIPHSARPPSTTYHGARYTLVIKNTASKDLAYQKFLYLEIEPLYEALSIVDEDEAISVRQFIEDAVSGKKTLTEIKETVVQYEKLIDSNNMD